MKARKNLIIIAGPTGVGKTALAVRLAQEFHTEIISADSRQFYREMKIGVARPSDYELRAVPHHFIGSHSILYPLNAGDFSIEALAKTNLLFEENNVVIVCGGSGLFIQGLVEGFDDLPGADDEYRALLATILQSQGIEGLQKMVMQKDPEYYEYVDIQNPRRLMRALEVINSSGRKYSELRSKKMIEPPFNVLWIGLRLSRSELIDRINWRTDRMMEIGLLKEVESLYEFKKLDPLKTVGYTELFNYLDEIISLPEAIDQMKIHTRQYAKRQMTWFSRKNLLWYHPENIEAVRQYIYSLIHL